MSIVAQGVTTQYKSVEAGIRCEVVEIAAPEIAVGSAMVATGQKLRRAAREVKRNA